MAKISPTNRPISATSGGQARPAAAWIHYTPEMTGDGSEYWYQPDTKQISWTMPKDEFAGKILVKANDGRYYATDGATPQDIAAGQIAFSSDDRYRAAGSPPLTSGPEADVVLASLNGVLASHPNLSTGEFLKQSATELGKIFGPMAAAAFGGAALFGPGAAGGAAAGGGIGAEGFGGGIYGAMEGTGAALPGITSATSSYVAPELVKGYSADAGMFGEAGAGSEFGYGAASTGGAIPAATGGSAADLLAAEGSTFGQPAATTGATAGTGALSSPSLPTAAPATTSGAIPSADAAAKAAKLKALGLTDAQVAAIAKTDALTAAGLTPSQIAAVTSTPGMFEKLLSGGATAADIAKLGISAAAVGALASEDPDRASTTKIEYPDWYNAGSKSALALADKYAALGPDSVAPLSDNENQAIKLAQTSAGDWRPIMDKSVSTLDAALPYYAKAGKTADTVSGYLNRSGALADEAAGGIPSIDLSAYMNPYLDNVLTPIARRNEIAKAAALNDIKAKAGMRGAFGGSRSTLLESQASEAADRNMNEAEANIRSGAFTTGLTAAQADLQRKLGASGQFGALGNVANNTSTAYTNIGRSLTDTAGGYKTDAGALGVLTDADIARLTSTGGLERGVKQAKLNAPLTAIGGYANALRGNPGSTTTAVAPEASKAGQITGALTALYGANKAGLF